MQPRDLPSDLRTGRWSPASSAAPSGDLTPAQLAEMERLQAIGYAAGVRPAPGMENVTIYQPEKSFEGVNLYTSGHAAEALLVDMHGRVLHRWRHDYETLWPDLEVPEDALGRFNWRRVHLYPNGDLLALHEGIGMIKLDRDSNLLWQYPGHTHHAVEVTPDGSIWVLTREVRIIPRLDPDDPSIEDFIVRLDPTGREVWRLSLLEALERGSAADVLARVRPPGQLLYANSLEILDPEGIDWLPQGVSHAALVSLRAVDAVVVVDLDAGRVVWGLTGDFRGQHEPSLLGNGDLLLFDNLGPGEGRSAVSELRPETGDVVWQYRGSEQHPFYSRTCGTSYRLPNGNTLITETDGGRAFEVTTQGEIVWEFYNPHRAGDHLEYIASLYDLRRFPKSFVDWLDPSVSP